MRRDETSRCSRVLLRYMGRWPAGIFVWVSVLPRGGGGIGAQGATRPRDLRTDRAWLRNERVRTVELYDSCGRLCRGRHRPLGSACRYAVGASAGVESYSGQLELWHRPGGACFLCLFLKSFGVVVRFSGVLKDVARLGSSSCVF